MRIARNRGRPTGAAAASPPKPFGFNIIGYVSGDLGLGVAVRSTIETLGQRGEPIRVIDVVPPQGAGSKTWFEHLQGEPGMEAPYAINFFQLTPPEIAHLAHSAPSWLDLKNGFNVCVPFWELPRFPLAWIPALRAMDLVLAPSRCIEDAVRTQLPRVPSAHYPQSVLIPAGVAPDRARWGLDPDAVVFLASFDANSDIERKNPWAMIEAFRAGIDRMPGAVLVVKVLTRGAEASAAAQLARLRETASNVDQLVLVEDGLDYADTLSLYASADVVVSTHRSEGLGLVLMEAMSLGKPVIATGWSGNMDFTTAENSLLLTPRLIPVRGSQNQYSRLYAGRGACWADVDVDQVAHHMITLAHDVQLRARLGARARSDMEERRAQAAPGGFVDALVPRYRDFLARGATGGRSPRSRNLALSALPAWHATYRLAADTLAQLNQRGGAPTPNRKRTAPRSDRNRAAEPRTARGPDIRPSVAPPLVSILTPSFNQARWLPDNLRSVRTQTYASLEHIVMDGGSNDGSVELLRQAGDPLRFESQPDRGQSHALNKALQTSRGEIIGWLNSDDAYFDRGVVRRVVEFFESHPEVDVVYGHGAFVNADGRVLLMIYVPAFSRALLRRYCFVLQPSVFLRRRVLDPSFLDESYEFTMDWELWLRLAHEGRRFARLDSVLAIDRLQPERKTVTAADVYRADSERLAERYGVPRGRGAGPAIYSLYVGLRIAGIKLVLRPRRDLAFDGRFDALPSLLRRQVFTRRMGMPSGEGS